MEFYSLQFILFLTFWLMLYYGIGRLHVLKGHKWVILLAASLNFYLVAAPGGLVYLLFTALTTWGASRWLDQLQDEMKAQRSSCKDRTQKATIKERFQRRRRVILWGCLLLNFGLLALLKCTGGLQTKFSGNSIFSKLIIPLGISFYTFQSISYLVDVYNIKYSSERIFWRYLLFVSWFPQLIEGPINRYDAMAPALVKDHSWNGKNAYEAFLLILFGFFKKYAIAEQLSPLISKIFDQTNAQIPGSVVLCGILMYSAQQYADFSGGIDIVIGVSKLFSVPMATNFRQPYFATSLGDFWRRWHISLGAWMRDYVFYPFALLKGMQHFGKWFTTHISGKLGKHLGRTIPACIANIVVFLIVGIWHGAEEHYVAWGLYNGIVIALSDLLEPLFVPLGNRIQYGLQKLNGRSIKGGARVLRVLRTFVIVNIGWYFDRISNWEYRLICFRNTFCSFHLSELKSTLYSYQLDYVMKPIGIAVIGVLVVLVVSIWRERNIDVKGRLMALPAMVQCVILVCVVLMILVSFVFTAPSGGFLYAQF